MTAPELISANLAPNGDLADKLAALRAALDQITVVGEYRPPRCACGATLGVWVGRHTGQTFISHPRLSARACPRQGFRAWGDTGDKAMRAYIEKAPDLGALDEHPEAVPEVDEDPDFSSEFQ